MQVAARLPNSRQKVAAFATLPCDMPIKICVMKFCAYTASSVFYIISPYNYHKIEFKRQYRHHKATRRVALKHHPNNKTRYWIHTGTCRYIYF